MLVGGLIVAAPPESLVVVESDERSILARCPSRGMDRRRFRPPMWVSMKNHGPEEEIG